MNRYLIAGMLLTSVVMTGHAEEAGMPSTPAGPVSAAGDSRTVEPGNAPPERVHFGTGMTDAVMLDISSRVADQLSARMARELNARDEPAKVRAEALLVSNN